MEADEFVVAKLQLGAMTDNDDYGPLKNVTVSTPCLTVLSTAPYKSHTNKIDGISPIGKDAMVLNVAEENKRAKRSAIEKKSRTRRQEALAHMRDQVKQLEQLVADMGQQKNVGLGHRSTTSRLKRSKRNQLQQKYSELTLVAHVLEQDQAALQQLWREIERVYDADESRRKPQVVFDIWDSGVPPSSSFAATFRPLSMAEGFTLVRESYEEIRKFTETENFATTGACFLGWVDKRKYDRKAKAILYSFTKNFPFESTENLFMKSWNAYLDGPKLEYFSFGVSAQSRFEVLQVLNNDLLVFRRDYRMSRFPMTFTSIQIMFRLQTSTGYLFCVRTIPSPEIQKALEPHEYPFDVFHWTHFNRLYNEYDEPAGCEIAMGGSVCDPNQLKSKFWWFEIVCSVLRWENAIIAPLFILQT